MGIMKAYAYDENEFRVNSVTLYKVYDRDYNMEKRVLSIGGRSLKDAPVYIETNEGHKKLSRPNINEEHRLQYELKEDELGEFIEVGPVPYG